MASLTTLPLEIILNIANYLLPSQLLYFSHTDSHIHQTTTTLLQPYFKYHRNKKEMIRRFGTSNISVGKPSSFQTTCLASNLDQLDVFEGPGHETTRDLEYLLLNGDLHWNEPLPKDVLNQHEWHQGYAASPAEIATILNAAKRMNVEIPAAMIDFISSQECINSMFLGGEYFLLTPKLVECLGCDDKEGGGFIVVFMHDQQDCGFTGLYVAPGGYHCVLLLDDGFFEYSFEDRKEAEGSEIEGRNVEVGDDRSQDEGYTEPDDGSRYEAQAARCVDKAKQTRLQTPERYKNVPLSKPCQLVLLHTDIEEWLVMKYFDFWIAQTWEDICEVEEEERDFTHSQMEYLRNCWTAD